MAARLYSNHMSSLARQKKNREGLVTPLYTFGEAGMQSVIVVCLHFDQLIFARVHVPIYSTDYTVPLLDQCLIGHCNLLSVKKSLGLLRSKAGQYAVASSSFPRHLTSRLHSKSNLIATLHCCSEQEATAHAAE